jgi:hypothetical protein
MEVKILRRRKKYRKTKRAENKLLTNLNGHYAEFKIKEGLNEMNFTF